MQTVFRCALLSIFMLVQGCQKSELNNTEAGKDALRANLKLASLSRKESNDLKSDFARVLGKAVKNDDALRAFLKTEALKKFNLDYDILYQLVKDKIVSNNETFQQKLLKYADDKELLTAIDNLQPLLTIYIPELPGGFSAESWNAETGIPAISTGIITDKKVTYYMPDGTQLTEQADLIPEFPLLAVKDNERVKLAQTGKASARNAGGKLKSSSHAYEFLSENFDGISKKQMANKGVTTMSECINCPVNVKVSNAYDIWLTQGAENFWQRDHIYYSITPSSPNGPLDPSFQEHLTGLKFKDGMQGYNKITDQNDPYATEGVLAVWTEGDYEFALTALINNTIGLGSTITKLFPVKPQDLFQVNYERVPPFMMARIVSITPKQYNLNVPIASWDIKNNGIGWKLTLAEVDPSQTTTHNNTVTSQFATNFGADVKIGLKFGATATFTTQNTYTLVTQLDDDMLGETAMFFYDPVITYDDIIPGVGPAYYFKDYDTGWALLTVQPKKVF